MCTRTALAAARHLERHARTILTKAHTGVYIFGPYDILFEIADQHHVTVEHPAGAS